MKIAVLNESFLKENHLQQLRELGEVVVYNDTDTEKLAIERLEGIDVAVADCWLTPVNKNVLSQAPQLRYLCLNSTGYDQVDLNAAAENNIAIANIPGFSTDGVAEHTIALMFAAIRHVPKADAAMRQRPFQVDPADPSGSTYLGTNIRGKTMGVIGLGQIGTRVAELAQGLGMKVIACNRTPRDIPGVSLVSLEELLAQSDVVSLNSALSNELADTINAETLKLMKPTAYLINTARGGLVDEKALALTLQNGKLGGAGLDVLNDWSTENPLLALDSVVFTPHIAYLTTESLENMANIIVQNIQAFAEGKLQNTVTG
jgi:lactate dehydrogenase-like 2-hydroxyacid dehydrogenase